MIFLFLVALFLIAYGSFYPFDFSMAALSVEEAERLFTSWKFYSGRGDVLGNVALFVPYGLFGVLAMPRERSFAAACVSLSIFGLMFAALLQVIQLGIVSRDAEMGDVIWNLAGIVLGAAAAQPRWVRDLFDVRGGAHAERALPMALFGLWAIATLAPFVPTIDFQAYKDSLKPLFAGAFALDEFFRATVSWFVVAYVGRELVRYLPAGPLRNQRVWLPLLAAGTLLAKIVVVQNALTLSDVFAAIVAVPCWFLILRLDDRVPRFLLSLLCISLFLSAFSPFGFRDESAAFHWIPFTGSLTGWMMINAKVIAEKIFLIGALFLMCRRCGYPLLPVTLAAAGYLLVLEIGQVWIGDHTPEITDAVLAVIAGIAFSTLGDRFGAVPPADGLTAAAARAPAREEKPTGKSADGGPEAPKLPLIAGTGAILLAVGCIGAAVVLSVVLSLPGIPYNVRELFGGDNAWWRLLLFGLAGCSIGMGGAATGRAVAEKRFPVLGLPLRAVGWCLVTYLLLVLSVTSESIADISGSANTYYYVTEKNIWGETGKWIFSSLLSPGIVAAVEKPIRFIALIGPLYLWIAIATAIYWRKTAPAERNGSAWIQALTLVLCAAPWLYLGKFIAFTRSSTDNLNELIQGNGAILYFLLLLLPATALAVVDASRTGRAGRIARAALLTVIAIPVGWLLFSNGLADEVHKYDKVFSGFDFLLGPDRDQLLPTHVLILRWAAVEITAIVALAYGMRICLPAVRPNATTAALGRNEPSRPASNRERTT